MKITHITLREGGGAGKAAFRLHDALLEQGFDSTVIVLFSSEQKPHVISYDCWGRENQPFRLLLWKVVRLTAPHLFFYSYFTPLRVEKMPEVENADLIILHQIDRFVNVPTFLSSCKDKQIRWRCPDFRPIFGEPYPSGTWPKLLWQGHQFPDKFKWIFTTEQARGIVQTKFPEFSKDKSAVIPNIVTCENSGLTSTREYLVFCSVDINDERKGLELLLTIWQDYVDLPPLIVIGSGDMEPTPNVKQLGFLNSDEMQKVHQESMGLITPAKREMFGQTTVESFLGGAPVLSNPTTGALSLIQKNINGRIHDFYASSKVENYSAIKSFLAFNWNSDQISSDAQIQFSKKNAINYLVN